MANIKSQKKRVLTNEKAHKRNVAVKSSLKTAVRATREAIAAGDKEKLCFLHYPPCYQGYTCPEIMALLEEYGVKRCYYGHLHADSIRLALEGPYRGTEYRLVSADHVDFQPQRIG